jgi:hypothetical protein
MWGLDTTVWFTSHMLFVDDTLIFIFGGISMFFAFCMLYFYALKLSPV